MRRRCRPAKALIGCSLLVLAWAMAAGHDVDAEARYLANEGVLVEMGDAKILFDPLFDEAFGQYRLLPGDMRRALMDGEPPWDGIDALFVTHYHDDHFGPAAVLDYLRRHEDVILYAPRQAAAVLRRMPGENASLLRRVVAVRAGLGDPPQRFERPGLVIDALRLPHAGWPDRNTRVEMIAWRVTLDDTLSVAHLGDADAALEHYRGSGEFWQAPMLDAAFIPYWFFLSRQGREVLDRHLRAAQSIGIHVPVSVPDTPGERGSAFAGRDLMTVPGETRELSHSH